MSGRTIYCRRCGMPYAVGRTHWCDLPPHPEPPEDRFIGGFRGERLLGCAGLLLAYFTLVYLGAHLLVYLGVGCNQGG